MVLTIQVLKEKNKKLKDEIKELKDTKLVKELLKGIEDIKKGRVIVD